MIARLSGKLAAVGAAGVIASTASAGFTTVDPGLYTSIEDRYDARIRLDDGNSQTWKAAALDAGTFGSAILANSGVQQNVFSSGVDYDFSIKYTASTGELKIDIDSTDVGDINFSTTQFLSGGTEFAAIRYFIKSHSSGTTTLTNMQLSVDGSTPSAVANLSNNGFTLGPTYYFDTATDMAELTGSIRFDVGGTSVTNKQGDRFAIDVIIMQGVPTPGTIALGGMAGLAAIRRRR